MSVLNVASGVVWGGGTLFRSCQATTRLCCHCLTSYAKRKRGASSSARVEQNEARVVLPQHFHTDELNNVAAKTGSGACFSSAQHKNSFTGSLKWNELLRPYELWLTSSVLQSCFSQIPQHLENKTGRGFIIRQQSERHHIMSDTLDLSHKDNGSIRLYTAAEINLMLFNHPACIQDACVFLQQLWLGLHNSGNTQSWKLSMGINRNSWE